MGVFWVVGRKGQSSKMRGELKERLSKKTSKGSKTWHFRGKISPIINPQRVFNGSVGKQYAGA